MKYLFFIIAGLISTQLGNQVFSQESTWPACPAFKSYKDKPGRVVKYNTFNYLDILEESGEKSRQKLGQYWEIAYAYDSTFRQKKKFKEFIINQVLERKGAIYFQDTLQIHFVVPDGAGNVWGRMVLSNDKVYRLRLIKEGPFSNPLRFDVRPDVRYEKYVDSVQFPPRLNFLPSSFITRTQYSKFNHQEFTWNSKDTMFRQKVMGPFWDIKLEVRYANGDVDRTMSTVEMLESYYRACQKAGGTIVKSRPRELSFTLPLPHATLWCRITTSLDGVYFVRAIQVDDKDKEAPVKMISPPVNLSDSSGIKNSDGRL